MPITAKQLEKRKKYIGSSDMAAIMGLDPFRSKYDIWVSKTKELEDEAKRAHLELGNDFEPIILAKTERELGKITPNQFRSAKDKGLPFGSNIDGIVVETGDPVEAKTSGLFWPVAEQWGDEGTDEVPHRIIIQCHVHMICTGKKVCHVPTLQWGMKFAMYEVPYDQEIADVIIEEAKSFWNNHVLANVAPDDSVPSLDVIKRIKREPKTWVDIEDVTVSDFADARDARLIAEKAEKTAKAKLIAALGEAEGGHYLNGDVTFLEQKQSRVDTASLKAELPGHYFKTITFRKLAIKETK